MKKNELKAIAAKGEASCLQFKRVIHNVDVALKKARKLLLLRLMNGEVAV